MLNAETIKVLLVEDDEDDHLITRDLLSEIRGHHFALDWAKTYQTGLEAMLRNQHDVCLVDYRLGAQTGIELLRAAVQAGCYAPIILLTGIGEHQVDLEAMQAGAADYLVKAQLQANSLERSIRYALQRKRATALAAFEQARLAAFGAAIGRTLTRSDPLDAILSHCARIMAQYLGPALAEISTFDAANQVFELRAQAGPLFDAQSLPAGPAAKLPLNLLTEGKPVLLRQLQGDERFPDQSWLAREGVVAFAGYPLLLEDKLVGLMSVFSQSPLTEQICQEMGSVATGIASCIERKRSAEALGASEALIKKLAAFPQVNPNPILELTADGALSYVNEAGRAMAESLGKEDLLSILPPNPATVVRDCLAFDRKKLHEDVNINGRTITWSFFPIVASGVVHCYGTDVTDVLNLEAQFRHAQKLESVGQLAAGIAHDFNNILTVIQGYSDCLLMQYNGDDASFKKALKQISDASQRAAALTRQLLMFSRKQVIQLQVLDLNTVLKNFSNMLPRLLGEDIKLESSYAADLLRIEGDTGMLEQVVLNLAVNARDAMPKGGKLRIATASADIGENYVRIHEESRVGQFVRLSVTDTGTGMDRKTLDRIFEPFFSTKDVGKGTGLGLATVYGIVKQHGGWIDVASQVDRGTTFEIYLPVSGKGNENAADNTSAPQAVRGGSETILLVEDEAVLREFVGEVLHQYDYRVVQAGSGVEALRAWDENHGQIDLLLTDMVMPEGMTGHELATQLRRRKPELKLIFTSGYSAEATGIDFDHQNAKFLSKPYLPSQLAEIVRVCLDATCSRS
jgi:signal transduction histidine kinase/DNA-binding response OmpR family regulator